MNAASSNPGTRERLVAAMREALSTRGYHGIGLNELLATAAAPKGVLYHHFPGGKSELAIAAIAAVAEELAGSLDTLMLRAGGDPAGALEAWMGAAQKLLERSGFERGCPLATVALETTPEDRALRSALASVFAAFRAHLASALAGAGIADSRARSLAALIVSAYEGALLQARVAGEVQPMRDTSQALLDLIRLSLPGVKGA